MDDIRRSPVEGTVDEAHYWDTRFSNIQTVIGLGISEASTVFVKQIYDLWYALICPRSYFFSFGTLNGSIFLWKPNLPTDSPLLGWRHSTGTQPNPNPKPKPNQTGIFFVVFWVFWSIQRWSKGGKYNPPGWQEKCHLYRFLRTTTTVDGWNPAPPGMYETL